VRTLFCAARQCGRVVGMIGVFFGGSAKSLKKTKSLEFLWSVQNFCRKDGFFGTKEIQQMN
jgi:hypothetical protein